MQPYIWIPGTLLLCYRAYSHDSLTPLGIATAALVAVAHGIHPWPLPFTLLVVFFLAGTRVTKIKKDVKAGLTLQSTGNTGGEGARTHIQGTSCWLAFQTMLTCGLVLANSGVAAALSLIHTYQLHSTSHSYAQRTCYPYGGSLLIIGIIANYAAVAADTFSSELGILSRSRPRLITSLTLRSVPPGTNGGVTLFGVLAGLLGSTIIVGAALLTTPFCKPTQDRKFDGHAAQDSYGGPGWTFSEKQTLALAMAVWGGIGSLLDSFLGGWFQASVIDTHTGKVVEGEGGKKVLINKGGQNSMHFKKSAELKADLISGREGKDAVPDQIAVDGADLAEKLGKDDRYDANKKMRQSSFGDGKPSRTVESGAGLLDNNEVNFLMALAMSVGAMQIAASYWGVPFSSAFRL